jgi:predicted nucleotidyltransferase
VSARRGSDRPLDVLELLRTLARHGVDYVVIGGVAVQVHGHRRTTMDLDLVPAPSEENYERLSAALEELDARQREVEPGSVEISPSDPGRLATAPIVPPLVTRHGQIHILNEVKDAPPFAELRQRALVVELEDIEVRIVGLDDLIRIKRASGRPPDLADIAALTALEGEEE